MGFLACRASAASGGSRGLLRIELASGPISLCAAMALPLNEVGKGRGRLLLERDDDKPKLQEVVDDGLGKGHPHVVEVARKGVLEWHVASVAAHDAARAQQPAHQDGAAAWIEGDAWYRWLSATRWSLEILTSPGSPRRWPRAGSGWPWPCHPRAWAGPCGRRAFANPCRTTSPSKPTLFYSINRNSSETQYSSGTAAAGATGTSADTPARRVASAAAAPGLARGCPWRLPWLPRPR